MDLKHTTKAELAEEIESLRQQLSAVAQERDGFKGMAEQQQELLRKWEKNCDGWRDLFFDCRDHPWRNLWTSILKKAGFLNSDEDDGEEAVD